MTSNSSLERVGQALSDAGIYADIREMPATTRTAGDAAAAIGCSVAQIVKSLVFQGRDTGRAILVLASGPNRVDTALVAVAAGEQLVQAKADFVRTETGFAIGGVSPIGHIKALPTYMDETLMNHDVVWAAAGKPNVVFAVDPKVLHQITNSHVLALTGQTG